MLLAGADRLII